MERLVLIARTVAASLLGLALFARVIAGMIKSYRIANISRGTRPPRTGDEKTENFEWLTVAEPVRGYDTPELYREDSVARLERATTGKQLR